LRVARHGVNDSRGTTTRQIRGKRDLFKGGVVEIENHSEIRRILKVDERGLYTDVVAIVLNKTHSRVEGRIQGTVGIQINGGTYQPCVGDGF